MVKKFVVPLGGFYPGEAAIDVAVALARRIEGTVELLTVTPEGTETEERAALETIANRHAGVTIPRVVTDEGGITQAILHETDDPETMICVESAGRGALTELVEGSPSEDLIRGSRFPLVVVGPMAALRPEATDLAVALDGGSDAEAILPHAQALAEQLGLSLFLVQVVDPTPAARDETQPMAAYESNYLIGVARRLAPTKRAVNWDVLHGNDIIESLADFSRRPNVAMIAMATHGPRPLDRMLLGGVTFKLIKSTACPLLVWHPTLEEPRAITYRPDSGNASVRPLRRVVVGVGPGTPQAVVEWASEAAVARGAQLQIIHAWQYPYVVSTHGVVPPVGAPEGRDAQIDTVVARAAEVALRTDRELPVEVIVTTTSFPVEALLAASDGADLLVVGRHDQSALERFVMGSVSEACARRARCAVAVVPNMP